MNEYPQVLDAVERVELSLWPVVDALLAEVAANVAGEMKRVAAFLAKAGYRSWSEQRLGQLYRIGVWAYQGDQEIRAHSVERVIEARRAAKADHARALQLLRTTTTKRQLRPDRANVSMLAAALVRMEILEQITSDPEVAAILHQASADVYRLDDKKKGIVRRDLSRRREPTRMEAQLEIKVALHKLALLAQELNLEAYLLEQMEAARERVEASLAMGNPKQAVEELVQWLAEQDTVA